MINPRELRLGNYILSRETREPQTVTAIGEDYICFDAITIDYPTPEEINPLPLTDEYWDLFGFKKAVNLYYKDYFNIEHNKFQYVHELQNLYFAITKTELI
jgi:hypothetical protein